MLRSVIIGVLFCVATQSTAQKKELNKDAWKDAVNGVKYIENGEKKLKQENSEYAPANIDDLDRVDKKEDKDYYEDEREKSSYSYEEKDHRIPSWLSTFLIIVVVGLLLYIIVLTVVKNPSVKLKATSSYQLNDEELKEIEDNPFDNDLEKHIYEARTSGNLKLAIRLSFIYVIRLLSENELIKWKKDKTNSQYLRELSGSEHKPTYAYLKTLFETVWYGEIELEEHVNLAALERFDHNINSLKHLKKGK